MQDGPPEQPKPFDQDEFWNATHPQVHHYNHHHAILLIVLGLIAIVGIIAGTVLATADYSSAGAFSVASACVGVLGTLIVMDRNGGRNV